MAIPDFQSVMLPLLEFLSDGADHTNQDILDALAVVFHLSHDELSELLPSGQQSRFANRVAWAKTHLKAAGIVESPRRGVVRITDRGQEVLAAKPGRVDLRFLAQYPEYQEFRKVRRADEEEPGPEDNSGMTPLEHIEYGYSRIRAELAAELIRYVKDSTAAFFEDVVVKLLLNMGYGGSRSDAGRTLGRSGDGGVDGVIMEDRLGLDVIYIQAKKWENMVGSPDIQKFAGALQGQKAKKGVFITTSRFSKEAEAFAARIDNRIVLIDGDKLAELMIDYGVGVTPAASYEIRRIDLDFFEPS